MGFKAQVSSRFYDAWYTTVKPSDIAGLWQDVEERLLTDEVIADEGDTGLALEQFITLYYTNREALV